MTSSNLSHEGRPRFSDILSRTPRRLGNRQLSLSDTCQANWAPRQFTMLRKYKSNTIKGKFRSNPITIWLQQLRKGATRRMQYTSTCRFHFNQNFLFRLKKRMFWPLQMKKQDATQNDRYKEVNYFHSRPCKCALKLF